MKVAILGASGETGRMVASALIDNPEQFTSGEEIQATIVQAKEKMAQGATDFATQLQLFGGQYQYSWGIRGDNTVEHAQYLGYLDARELYPDLQPRVLKDYVQAIVEGTAPKVWEASQDWGN